MNHKLTSLFLLIFLFNFSEGIFSQKFTLKITSKDSISNSILKKFNYHKKFTDLRKLEKEASDFSKKLQLEGYFLNVYSEVISKKDTIIYISNLGPIINKIKISINEEYKPLLKNYKPDLNLDVRETIDFLVNTSKELEENGYSFSQTKLTDIRLKNNTVSAKLYIEESSKRRIDKIVIKGYENFPKKFLKNHLRIKKSDLFSKSKILEISKLTESIKFVEEKKQPELLFTKDSTFVYLYLEKLKKNSIDGLLNFASKENGNGLILNGHLDLKLLNILNTGEKINFLFKSNGEERQLLELNTSNPYIFNSPLSLDLAFSIYKQDSSFLNTKFETNLSYNLKNNNRLGLTFSNENSEDTNSTILNQISTFEKIFIGLKFESFRFSNTFKNDYKYYFSINPSLGKRKTSTNNESQFNLQFNLSYLFDLGKKNAIYFKNETGLLFSENYFKNEIYRIGGANSIRGFNEQSIFTSKYSFINLEYRYKTSNSSYLYSITDFAKLEDINSNSVNLIGLGLGYLFTTKNSTLNLGYVIGNQTDKTFSIDQSVLIFTLTNYF